MSELVALVRSFHEAFGLRTSALPRSALDPTETAQRVSHLREELEELVAAIETESVEDIADGVADLLYLTIGTALAYGIPIEAVFDEIHRSNMTKTLPPDAHGRPVKGATFRPPCFDWLRDAGAVPRRRE